MLLAVAGVFVSCNEPEPESEPSTPTIALNGVQSIIASSDSDIDVPVMISCENSDELSTATATVFKADGSVLKNIAEGEMTVTKVSSRKWDVKISFPYDKDAEKIKITATTKNGGEKTAEFPIIHGSAGMEIKVKFTSGYDMDFKETDNMTTTEWNFGWAKMEVGVKPGNKARINDLIYITASKNPEGKAETYDEYDAMARSERELLPHRFMLITRVTDEEMIEGSDENKNIMIQYLEGDYFMVATDDGGKHPAFEWNLYTKGADLGSNSIFIVTDFDRKDMIISGYCEAEFFNFHEMTNTLPETRTSKAKVRIDFKNLQLNTVENPWWSTVYQMPLREE